jgi:hypothetical protein
LTRSAVASFDAVEEEGSGVSVREGVGAEVILGIIFSASDGGEGVGVDFDFDFDDFLG